MPWDGGVDGVVPVTVRGEQADRGGTVQQADPGGTVKVGRGRHRAASQAGRAHSTQVADVDETLEQGEQGEDGMFILGEGLAEAVVEGGGEGGDEVLCGIV